MFHYRPIGLESYVGYISKRSTRSTSTRSKMWTRSSSTPSRSWWSCRNENLNKILTVSNRGHFYENCIIKCFKCSHQRFNNFCLQEGLWREKRTSRVEVSKCWRDDFWASMSDALWLLDVGVVKMLLRRTNNIVLLFTQKLVRNIV